MFKPWTKTWVKNSAKEGTRTRSSSKKHNHENKKGGKRDRPTSSNKKIEEGGKQFFNFRGGESETQG